MQEGRIGGSKPVESFVRGKKIMTGVGIYHYVDQKLPFEDEHASGSGSSTNKKKKTL